MDNVSGISEGAQTAERQSYWGIAYFYNSKDRTTLFGRPCTPKEKGILGSPLVNVFEEGRVAQKTRCSIPTVVVEGFNSVNSI